MKGILRMVGAALVACTLVSCATANNAGGLVNGTFGMAGRLLQAMGRTVGLTSQVDEPKTIDSEVGDPANVEARGRLIESQGSYGAAHEEAHREKMVSAH